MSIAGRILATVDELPPDKQEEILDFAEFLARRCAKNPKMSSVKGLWSNLGVDITDEDIAEARREMWGNFPREDIGQETSCPAPS